MQKATYDLFLTSYQGALKSLMVGNIKKAHRQIIKAMDYHHQYLDQIDGIERLKSLKFDKST